MFCPSIIFAALPILKTVAGPECGAQEGSRDGRGSVLSGRDSGHFWWEQNNVQDKYISVGPGVVRDQALTLPGSQRVVAHGHSEPH